MTCICGAPIFHVEFVQTIRDDRVPFEIYHWHCPACSTLMEELRLEAHPIHCTSSSLMYPVRPVQETTGIGV